MSKEKYNTFQVFRSERSGNLYFGPTQESAARLLVEEQQLRDMKGRGINWRSMVDKRPSTFEDSRHDHYYVLVGGGLEAVEGL